MTTPTHADFLAIIATELADVAVRLEDIDAGVIARAHLNTRDRATLRAHHRGLTVLAGRLRADSIDAAGGGHNQRSRKSTTPLADRRRLAAQPGNAKSARSDGPESDPTPIRDPLPFQLPNNFDAWYAEATTAKPPPPYPRSLGAVTVHAAPAGRAPWWRRWWPR